MGTKDITVSIFREYAILVDSMGQRKSKADNRFLIPIKAGETEQLSYNFLFEQAVNGDTFDFTLLLEEPYSQFGFYNLNAQ